MAVRPIYGMAVCAGAGGLELALRIALGADYRCVVYVEREAYAAATLVARMADATLDTAPVWDDAATFDGKPWRGVVDLVSAGFSCQPWSPAGKRLGIEDERWLWPDIARVVREVGPEWVFVENVPGLIHGGIEYVLGDLAAQGFDAEWDCVSAAEVGAPQPRERLYILAHAGGRRHSQWTDLRRGDADGHSHPSASLDNSDTRRCRRTGESMGNTEYTGHQWVRPTDVEWTNGPGSRCEPEGPSNAVGNTERQSLALGTSVTRDDGAQQPTVERTGCYWPPDRSYEGEWPSGFEPALRRVADGMAPWVERLRLTGNGVVPLAARSRVPSPSRTSDVQSSRMRAPPLVRRGLSSNGRSRRILPTEPPLPQRRSKYGNQQAIGLYGELYDSKAERLYAFTLEQRRKAHLIDRWSWAPR